ncbi:hypothetical protein GFS03_02395 [Sulfolobus sp. E5-1-F]|uniref:hypothetical protein n=1 Tax=Saccharolobus sp. E5-1-F TaxID=2663019 RepID=UPI0012965A1A|nr:hypothetical protein [Sulfolobus sp. E5-1-F]QGA53520.1 hypothetical protein GFS03_02395 [Sulfolobus sp. E5-1-F]
MDLIHELKSEYGFDEDEINYALSRARGIIFGFAMEYRARRILQEMHFENIKSVDMPTHDIEAEKDGIKYYVEVKASKKSPTREYSAYKVAMIALLDGVHLTLSMIPRPNLLLTEEILSEPKRILYRFFKLAYTKQSEELKVFLENEKNREVLDSYSNVIKTISNRYHLPITLDLVNLFSS